MPVGPFHLDLHEPAHFAVYVDGETIKGCDYRGFMAHRGIEKLCQTQVSYNEVPFIAERICGICGSRPRRRYSQAVELAAGLKISRRAEYIRTVMLEIERLHSHLLWLGVAGHLIGFDTVFMQAWRVREQIMWLARADHRQPQDLRHDRRRRRPPRHHAGDPGRYRGVLDSLEKRSLVLKNVDHRGHRDPPPDQGRRDLSKEETVLWSLRRPRGPGPRRATSTPARDHPYAAYDDMAVRRPGRRRLRRLGNGRRPGRSRSSSRSSILRQALDRMPPTARS